MQKYTLNFYFSYNGLVYSQSNFFFFLIKVIFKLRFPLGKLLQLEPVEE